MRENVRDHDRLVHIAEAIDNILNFTDDKTKEELEADKLRYYGIVKHIEIVGEAAYKLTHAFRRQHPETPWDIIAKMRHVLVHDYYQINPDEVWTVVQDDLRPLRQQVEKYLRETDWKAWEKEGSVIAESATSKTLLQTAWRMKNKGYTLEEIQSITGLNTEDIEVL